MNASAKPAHSYSLAAYAPFRTPDGGGFNASILRDGVKVGAVFDAGNGGCYDFHFKIDAEHDAFIAAARAAGDPADAVCMAMDCFTASLADDADYRKRVARLISSRHLFVVNGKVQGFKSGAPRVGAEKLIAAKFPNAVRLFALKPAEAFAAYEAAEK